MAYLHRTHSVAALALDIARRRLGQMTGARGLRIGILGCARIAKTALIDVRPSVPEIEVIAVASRDPERSTAFARTHGVSRAYGDYGSLLADPEVDAVYNPLPNSLHAEWSIRALEAGKAVLCEKPMASNADEARRMADAARAAQRPLVEAFHYRYHPLAVFVADLFRSGRLGVVRSIDAGLLVPGDLFPPDNIRFQFDLAGGAMMDVGAYCINALRLVAGEEPLITQAKATRVISGVEGAMQAHMTFPSGAVGSLQCSLVAEKFGSWLTVEAELGRLRVDNPFLPQRGHRLVLESAGRCTEQIFDRTPTYVFQARAFASTVLAGGEIRTTAEDAIANMTAIDAVYRAADLAPRPGMGSTGKTI